MHQQHICLTMLSAWTVILTINFVGVTFASTEIGPSILSLIRPIVSPLPFLYEPNTIHLENYANHAVLLPIAEGRSWVKSEEIFEILGKDAIENTKPFTVIPPKGHGLMVVIQELQIPAYNTLNRSLLVVAENGRIVKCFSKFEFQMEDQVGVRVCGQINSQAEHNPSVVDGVGPRSFFVPEGKSMKVRFIYRDHEIRHSTFLQKQVPSYDFGYVFRASIAFTAYKTCPHGPPYEGPNSTKFWPCKIPRSDREPVSACVREEVFCDNVINCGIHDTEQFSLDEKFCMGSSNGSFPPAFINSPREGEVVDVPRLEEAIQTRLLVKRPYELNGDMTLQMTPNSPSPFDSSEPVDSPSVSHPAFVALIVLIAVICLLLLGLLFRFCCKTCVGKPDPFGDTSNPEALARFHENLRSRDNQSAARAPGAYRISLGRLFKPSDDLPPSYDDLFPEPRNKPISSRSPSSASNNSTHSRAGVGVTRIFISGTRTSVTEPHIVEPAYTVPVPQPNCAILAGGSAIFTNDSTYINPSFVHIDSDPGTSRGVHPSDYGDRSAQHSRIETI